MTQEDLLKYNIEHVKNSIPGIEKKAGCTKAQLCTFFNTSLATVNRSIATGEGIPGYIKGRGSKAKILFPLIGIAVFLTEETIK